MIRPMKPQTQAGRRTFQFSLRHILGLVAMVALATCLIRAGQPVVLVTLSAVYSVFVFIHTLPNLRSTVVCLASLLFMLSMYLPAIDVHGVHSGWDASVLCLGVGWSEISRNSSQTDWVYFLILSFGNLLMLLSPVFIQRIVDGRGKYYGTLILLCGVAGLCMLLLEDIENLRGGFYCWCASFLFVSVAALLPSDLSES